MCPVVVLRIAGTYLTTPIVAETDFLQLRYIAVVFEDMAIYSMVKNNTFNGIGLPDIVVRREDGREELVRRFGYENFAARL